MTGVEIERVLWSCPAVVLEEDACQAWAPRAIDDYGRAVLQAPSEI